MIVIYDGLGANEEKNPNWGRDSKDRNRRTTIFFGLFLTSLSLIPKCLNNYKMILIAEMIYKKKHIDWF